MSQFNRLCGWLGGGAMAEPLLWSIALVFIVLIPVIQQTSQEQASQREASQHQQAIVGTVLTSLDQQAQQHRLKIESISLDPQDFEQEILLYTVLYQRANGDWHNLCQPDSEGVEKAIPLSGRWNETGSHVDDGSITFACTNGAIAKCVRWGYKPWKTVKGESLRDYHQACTRMVRADYCGNGIAHTKKGTPVDVYDRLGVQQRTKESSMTFEAAWGIDGAVMLHRTRFPDTLNKLQQDCSDKIASTAQFDTQSTHHRERSTQPLLFNDSFIQNGTP